MPFQLKRAQADVETVDRSVHDTVAAMLERIRTQREAAVRDYARSLDGWERDFVLDDAARERLIASVPQGVKDDLRYAHDKVRRFAEAQRASIREFSMETEPGITLGQRLVPVGCVGAYVPGGRYAHVASAIMTIATAKAAGVERVVAASPPRGETIDPAVCFAMDLAGADTILQMGGVHAMATMAMGLFDLPRADVLVGPGNAYVAQAKRLLFGEVGIDVLAGPTETAIIADGDADAQLVAIDLASQAEHGPNSPAWLFTTSRDLGERVNGLMDRIARTWPSGETVAAAWRDHGEIVVCETREEMAAVSDAYAPEHLQVMADDLGWWRDRLRSYGSLFLGAGSTVTHGDKCSGTNHVLPTRGAARYTGGLNVMKYLKVLTWQEIAPGHRAVNAAASRISRVEGMDGHARACDRRLREAHPDERWDFEVALEELG